jgi:hypothetical protein
MQDDLTNIVKSFIDIPGIIVESPAADDVKAIVNNFITLPRQLLRGPTVQEKRRIKRTRKRYNVKRRLLRAKRRLGNLDFNKDRNEYMNALLKVRDEREVLKGLSKGKRYTGTVVVHYTLHLHNAIPDDYVDVIEPEDEGYDEEAIERIYRLDIKNKTREEIVSMLRGRVLREIVERHITQEYSQFTIDFVEADPQLTALFEQWYGESVDTINSGNFIRSYPYLDASINDYLDAKYREHNYKDCMLVYLSEKLLSRRRRARRYKTVSEVPLKRGGVTQDEVWKFLKSINATYYAVDEFGNLLSHNAPSKRRFVPIAFCIANNHVYDIDFTPWRLKSMAKLATRKDARTRDMFSLCKRGGRGGASSVSSSEYLNDMLDEQLKKGIVPINETSDVYDVFGKEIKVIRCGNVFYRDNKEVEEAREICRKLEVKEVDAIPLILHKKRHNYPYSMFSEKTKTVFRELRAIPYSVSECDESVYGREVKSVDLRGAYRSMLMNVDEWPHIGPTNDGYPGCLDDEADIFPDDPPYVKKNNIYLVEAGTELPFQGNGIYPGFILRQALINHVPFKIKWVWEPDYMQKNNTREWIKEDFGEKMKRLTKDETKKLFNYLIGMLRRDKITKTQGTYVYGDKAAKLAIENHNASVMKHPEIPNVYHVERKIERELPFTYKLINYWIMWKTNCAAYEMAIKLKNRGCTIVGIQTDAVKYIGDVTFPDKSSRGIGEWGQEKSTVFYDNIKSDRDQRDLTKILDMLNRDTDINFKPSGTIYKGRAGTGKTYTLTHLALDPERDKPAYVAYTNKVARNLPGGLTTTSAFTGDYIKEGKVKHYNRTVVIDEIYCMPIDHMLHLHILQKHKCKLISAGDPYQLSMIMEKDRRVRRDKEKYLLRLIKYMFPKVIILKKIQRYDDELLKHTNPLDSNILAVKRIDNLNDTISTDYVHITHTNKTRLSILQLYTKKGLHDIPEAPYTPKCTNHLHGFYLGCVYTLSEIRQHGWPLSSFVLAYATTTHKYQGSTITKKIVIHDLRNMLRSPRLRYTAMTRATRFSNLSVSV